jgi:calreticulin
MGKWAHTAGEWYAEKEDKGIQTSEDARFYGLSAKLAKEFVSKDKELVIQYSVKHEQDLDCGGAYIKLMPGGKKFDAANFGGETPYAVMFGPDICGSSNKKTHVILNYAKKGENLLITKNVNTESDNVSHLFTLVVRPDNTFEVFIDNKSVRKGKLEEEFDFLPAKEIKDPSASKPDDWVDSPKMADPADIKPEGYDDITAEIADPTASKPDDWDDEDDGEWEPPMIDNPDYKGPWKAKMVRLREFFGSACFLID